MAYGYTYEGVITSLNNNEIFVFGSNKAGRHGKGAALTAYNFFGAIYGKGKGIMGNSYAIPTKDENLNPLSYDEIYSYVTEFISFAKENPQLNFYVTKIGCGLASLDESKILIMFKECKTTPNVHLPKEWVDCLKNNL